MPCVLETQDVHLCSQDVCPNSSLGTHCSGMYRAWTRQGFSSWGCRMPCLGRGHGLPSAAYCHVTSALTPAVCTKPSTGQRSTEYSCLNTRKNRNEHEPAGTEDTSLRDLQRGHGRKCVLGRKGSIPTGYVPEELQLWATYIRERTSLRDYSCGLLTLEPPTPEQQQPWGTTSDPHWGRYT